MLVNRTAFFTLMAAAMVLMTAASPAKADTIYTTGGTPPNYTTAAADTLGAIGVFSQSFVPTETATLTDVQLPLAYVGSTPPPPNEVTVYIESSSGGAPTGTILDTLGPTAPLTTTPQIFTVTCTTCSTLTVGTTYFVVAQQTSGADLAAWYVQSPVTMGTVYFSETGSTATLLASSPRADLLAFEVDGTPAVTPEPSSLLLLGAGLLGLLVIARKRFVADGLAQT